EVGGNFGSARRCDYPQALYTHLRDTTGERVMTERAARRIQKVGIEGIGQGDIEGHLVARDGLDRAVGPKARACAKPRLRRAIPYQRVHLHEVHPVAGDGTLDNDRISHVEVRGAADGEGARPRRDVAARYGHSPAL